ncbi:signal peptidase II [bacterium]|nr:signal peptidase II [bacterium]MBU1637682.1 signal peptidase II [bacterium]MBU1919660.1 signal peptidase II [bacterium]RQV93503.1 MAG: signal peptidase II [bacterium]
MTDDTAAAHRVWPWYTALIGIIVLDQLTKYLVRANLNLHDSIPLLGEELLRLTHVQNPGIIFGHTFISLPLLLVFGWTASLVLAVYLFRLVRRHDPLRWPVLLFLAGAIGNSIDRTLFGTVTDFIDADFPDFIMDRWAVFNVADSCVTVGITLMIWITFLEYGRHKNSSAPAHEQLSDTPNSISTQDCAGSASGSD